VNLKLAAQIRISITSSTVSCLHNPRLSLKMTCRLTVLVVTLYLGTKPRALELRKAEFRRLGLPSEAAEELQISNGSLIALTSRASACGHYGRRARRVAWGECAICNLAPFERPTMYAKERADGCGARLQEIISWAGVAARSKLNFGGVITNGVRCQESHGADVFRAVSAVLGLKSPTDLFIEFPPKFDREYKGVNDFHKKFANGEKTMKEYVPMGDVLVRDNCLACELDRGNLSDFLSPKLLFFLRSESKIGGRYENMTVKGRRENRPLVAVHVRRGDVRPGTPFSLFTNEHDFQRLSPDDWYYEVVGRILKVLPNADVHVFSSTENKYSSSDFDGFRQRNMTVHLDGDILDAWAVMAHAKVLVMAKSAFSHVPAYLNTNCILFQPWWHKPLDGWILARDANGTGSDHSSRGNPFFDISELRRCLDRTERLNRT